MGVVFAKARRHGLAPGSETMTEHEYEGRLQHRFIRLLKASLFIKGVNFVS